MRLVSLSAWARAGALALLPATYACGGTDLGEGPAHPRHLAALPDTPYWNALRRLDLERARASAAGADELELAEAIELALRVGSEGAQGALCALAGRTEDARVERWAAQAVVNLHRIEGRWRSMAGLEGHCSVRFSPGGLPPHAADMPDEEVDLPRGPVVLELLSSPLRLPLVEASSGRETVRALVDTGFTQCAVASDQVERLGVRVLGEGPTPIQGATGARVHGRAGVIARLELGELVARELPVVVIDAGELRALLPDVDLILGWELLQRFVLEIAGAQGELVLRPPGEAPQEGEPNLVLLRDPIVRLETTAGERLLFALDTGATATEATPNLVRRLGLRDLPRRPRQVAGLGARVEDEAQVIESLELVLDGTLFELGDLPVWEEAEELSDFLDVDGTLAADVAFAGRLVIDGPGRRVRLLAR